MEAAEAGVWQPRCNRWPLMARGGNWNGEIHRRPEAGACRALETWNGFSSSWKPVLARGYVEVRSGGGGAEGQGTPWLCTGPKAERARDL